MSGRGSYGDPAPKPKTGTSGWTKLALAAGVGAAGYFVVWPWFQSKRTQKQLAAIAALSPPPPPPQQQAAPAYGAPVMGAAPTPYVAHAPISPEPYHPLAAYAHANGFSSVADYENSVLMNARQVRNTGAHVTFAPHLSHLARLLDP